MVNRTWGDDIFAGFSKKESTVMSFDAVYIFQDTTLKLYKVNWFPNAIEGQYTKYELNQIFRDSTSYDTITYAVNRANVICEEMYDQDGWIVGQGVILLGEEDIRDES